AVQAGGCHHGGAWYRGGVSGPVAAVPLVVSLLPVYLLPAGGAAVRTAAADRSRCGPDWAHDEMVALDVGPDAGRYSRHQGQLSSGYAGGIRYCVGRVRPVRAVFSGGAGGLSV